MTTTGPTSCTWPPRSGTAGLSGYGPEENSSPIIPPAEQAMHSAGLYGAIAALLAVRSGRARRSF